jgi:sortase A
MSDETLVEPTRSRRRANEKKRRSKTILGVTGEILITLGVVVQLFWLWNVGINDWIQGFIQKQAASSVSQEWREEAGSDGLGTENGDDIRVYGTPAEGPPPVVDVVSQGTAFATIYVPRFGDTYQRVIGEGVDLATVLNNSRLGVGRYPQSTPLGEEGNFAIAGHRTSFGASFGNISELRLGDRLYVETREGWYSYAFRNLEYVWASEVDVLNPVPKQDAVEVTDRILTLTSCHPRFSDAERIIAYAVFDGWYPRAGGPPAEIANIVGTT